MVEIREGKLADAEVPVRVAGPLEVELVTEIERERDVFAFELVNDGAVVDAVDGNLSAGALVEEAVALLAELGDIYRGDVEFVLVDVEVGKSFLVFGVDFEEDYVLGVMVSDDDFAEELPVGLFGESAEMLLKAGIEVVGFDVLAGEEIMITED